MTYYATAEEIAKLQRWSVAYVRKLACNLRWDRRGTRPVLYSLDDVSRYVALTRPKKR